MALQKQSLNLPFMGLDQKNDPFKVAPGKFLSLVNTIPIKGGPAGILLQKRNGFGFLPTLPDSTNSYLSTFNGNLTAIGTSFNAYSEGSKSWVNKGNITPLTVNTLSLIKNNTNQTYVDAAIASNGLLCVAYIDVTPGGTLRRYAVIDSVTGQNIVAPTTFTSTGSPRVFVLNNYFMIVYPNSSSLLYIAITINNPTMVTAPTTISSQLTYSSTNNFDGYVTNNALYLAWNGSDMGGAIRVTYISATLTIVTPVVFATNVATLMSVTADTTQNPAIIWVSFYDSVSKDGYSLAVDQNLNTVLVPTLTITGGGNPTILNLASAAQNSLLTVMAEAAHNYSYDSGIPSHFITAFMVTETGGSSTVPTAIRSVGLASKAFIIDGIIYYLTAYQSPFQPTYFMMKFDNSVTGKVIQKLAYSNGGGYLTTGLPAVTVQNETARYPYLFKDLIEALSKTDISSSGGIYSQTGINLASITFDPTQLVTSEIGSNLNLSGGFLWAYDGYVPVEQEFHLWPDSVEVTTSGSGGFITAQQYFYQVTYEWSDNQGNIFRSAPSIPVSVTTTGSTSSNTINVPTLRLTYKTANPVKIVIYRWSTAQQTYFQVTSVTSPTLNSTTTDSIAFVDTLSDASILGNNIIYTTGGVLENIAPPATSILALFKSRLFLVDAEDQNLLWFSKQVIESTPVEMSDLLTLYVAPTTSAQGNSGPITALSSMDDKLIIFKKDAIYYLTGLGPDNLGNNNDFSDPIFITSTVGCANPKSIVFMPQGLMFQSDKGIWLLGRDLSTRYIGAPVENFNSSLVLSSLAIPGTNQVRFTLSNGITLMYDYYFDIWGFFEDIPGISSTLYQSLHTFMDSSGRAFQETPNVYLDGTRPTLISFQTGWINVAGLQGYERLYDLYLLGEFFSPHKLIVSLAYDYSPVPSQQTVISPNNFNGNWGSDPSWGDSTPWGGNPTLEQWRIHTQRQTCQAFQISVQEIFDASYGVPAGAGLTLSNMNLRIGVKKNVRPIRAANTAG